MQTKNQEVTIIDAEDLVLGRMASTIAKRLLKGEKITIVNAEKAVLSGKKKSRVSETKEFLEVGHPKKGPFHYRRPDKIVRRAVRGMLPYKQPKGKQAHKRLKAFTGIPEELVIQSFSAISLICSSVRYISPFTTLGSKHE